MIPFQRHILLATDLSARCDRAFDRAILLAREWDARLTVAHALESEPPGRGLNLRWRGIDRQRQDAEVQIRADLEDADMAADVIIRPGPAATLIGTLARTASCDLIVAGVSRGADIAQAMHGSTVEAMARASAIPVLSVGQPARNPYASVVVGTNFSGGSRAALRATLGLFPEAEVTTLHAYRRVRESMAGGSGRDVAYQYLVGECTRFVTEAAPGHWPRIRRLAEAGYAETLLKEYALERQIDLIAVGLEDRHPLVTFFLGGTIEPLLHQSPSDVLIVPAKWTSPAALERASGPEAFSGEQRLLYHRARTEVANPSA